VALDTVNCFLVSYTFHNHVSHGGVAVWYDLQDFFDSFVELVASEQIVMTDSALELPAGNRFEAFHQILVCCCKDFCVPHQFLQTTARWQSTSGKLLYFFAKFWHCVARFSQL
jgi:hypothetical protein